MGVKQDVLFKQRQIYMINADVARLTAELTALFPAVRFVEYEYWKSQAAVENASPASLRVPYRPALTGTEDPCRLRVWLEPEGWRPEWTAPEANGYRFIANKPKSLFIWYAPTLREGSWDSYTGRNTLEHATIVACYAPGDAEHLRLINRTWRLLKRIAVNNVELCENHLGMEAVLGPKRSELVWIGHAAFDWLYEDKQRVIWGRHRPCDGIDRAPGWWR